ncbi:MAG: DNA repair protein RadA, partial [Muribaculaceae bacterium]|nr:DNA repair protein RadA [Muribaculaceae bacterium]
ILSSNVDMTIQRGVCMTGEVGLSGEIRPVTRIEQRLHEAQKLGMTTILIPRGNLKGIDTTGLTIKIVEVAKVEEAFRHLFA